MVTIPFKVIRDLGTTIREAEEIWRIYLAALKLPHSPDQQEMLRGFCKKMDGMFKGVKEKIKHLDDGE
jgi:hypothetical protein